MLIYLKTLLPTLSSILRSRAALQLENLALRHQIGVLQRSARRRPKLTSRDRLLWMCLSRLWSDWRSALAIVQPETVLAWHRAGFRLFWTWKVRRGQPGRPVISREVRDLIRKMCRENPSWGAVATENSVRSENTEVMIIREIMVTTTMSSLFVALFALVVSSFRTRAALEAEILALRHQLAVFQNNAPPRLRLHRCDRLLWIVLCRFWSDWRRCLHMVQPDTVLRW